MRCLFFAIAALIASPVAAQVSNPAPAVDTSSLATKAEVQQAQQTAATAVATMPVPANTAPPSEALGAQTGAQIRYAREDHVHPRITRAAVVTTDSNGAWSVTWSSSLSMVPVVLPIPVNATTQPIVCNVATRTATSASGRCWLSRTLPATLTLLSNLVSFDVFGGAASSISVQILAIPPTQ